MKKLVLMALAAAAFSAGSASAQYPPPQYAPAPYGPGGPAPSQYAPAPYGPGGPIVATSQPGCSTCGSGEVISGHSSHSGFHPFLRRFFGIGGGMPQQQTLPVAQPGQGQLAFPVNPFIRSPRDFFMY